MERKSLPDLFGSFTSGRLYHQAELMSRNYKVPVLLIEFEQDKQFRLQGDSDIGQDITPNNIISKLVLLTLHFPKLRCAVENVHYCFNPIMCCFVHSEYSVSTVENGEYHTMAEVSELLTC